jgi:hypothetical protein
MLLLARQILVGERGRERERIRANKKKKKQEWSGERNCNIKLLFMLERELKCVIFQSTWPNKQKASLNGWIFGCGLASLSSPALDILVWDDESS